MNVERSDFLAGPIVRRVEPGIVAVWVALRMPATVHLKVFAGLRDASETSGLTPDATGSVATRAVGSNLHLAVVVAKPPNNGSLTAGDLYSYDIEVETEDGTTTLDGFELLSDAAGGPGVHAHLALGYAPGRLPSFRIPP
ncbi:MAG: hypothetical protein ACPG77_12795, partial [Nannocystaceae bacterium]